MDFVSRLKQYLNSRGISVTQFADECQIPRPTASQLLAGRNKKVSDEIIGKIHYSYPDVSITWLMFGEGEMESGANIETSGAKLPHDSTLFNQHTSDIESDTAKEPNLFSSQEIQQKKTQEDKTSSDEFSFGQNTFSFSPEQPRNISTAPNIPVENNTMVQESKQITLTPEKGKSVTGIVVYYSDSTYESFVPDPDGKHPFMR